MKKYSLEIIISACILTSILSVLAYSLHFYKLGISDSVSDWGTFGNYIQGIIGTIFSFTSVVLIILTFKKQQETSVLQQFETTFFNLLNIQREMMKSVNTRFGEDSNSIEYRGQDFFGKFADLLFTDYMFFPDIGSKNEVKKVICELYEGRFSNPGPTLGPYYRHLYHFLKYTNTSEIYNRKQKYMDIIQSQMSDAELYCLFYNAICYGSEKLLPLLDNYGFLENIETKCLSFDAHKKMFYPKTKFKYNSKDVPLSEIDN